MARRWTGPISHGSHGDGPKPERGEAASYGNYGCCILEAVAYVAGEKHSDHPECACPVITTCAIDINDWIYEEDDELRTKALRPLINAIIDTKSNLKIEAQRRAYAARFIMEHFVPLMEEEAREEWSHQRALEVLAFDGFEQVLDELYGHPQGKIARLAAKMLRGMTKIVNLPKKVVHAVPQATQERSLEAAGLRALNLDKQVSALPDHLLLHTVIEQTVSCRA